MTPDDDPTRSRPPPGRGRDADALGHMLPVGTRLREYEVTGLIGEGGFGIVYLAHDVALQRRVAIKEYMPSSMASRVGGSAKVVVKSERHRETFEAGLKSFVNEARLLARFDHPALVKVYRFWEENGTAYMVMPYYEGPTLKSALAARREPPDEAALRQLLRPLIDALSVMHASQCYHRDIAPDNILLTAAGPLLLDFGAARRVIGDMTHALTVVLKPGYAPIEQYGDVATMTQGAWTDLYALACVVYFAITGKVPMSSVERLMDDRLEPLSRVAAGRYSARFLQAIDAALAVRPHDRPQTDAAFRALLDEPAAPPPAGFAASPEADAPTRIVPRTHLPTGTSPSIWLQGPVTGAPPPPVAQPPRRPPDEGATVIGRARPAETQAAPAPPRPAQARQPATDAAATVFETSRITRPPAPAPPPEPSLRGPDSRHDAPASGAAPWPAPASTSMDRPQTTMRPERVVPPPLETRAPPAAPVATASAAPPRATHASRAPLFIAGGMAAIALIVVGIAQTWLKSTPAPDTSPERPAAAPPARATTPLATAPAAPAVAEPASAAATLPTTPAPVVPPIEPGPSAATHAATETPSADTPPAAAPSGVPASAPPTAELPARHTASTKPEARPDTTPHREAPAVKPARTPSVQAKCSDILQKASLEQLTAEENAFLRRECR